MRASTFAPLVFAGVMAAAGIAAAVTPVQAATRADLSDSAYLAAARCAGIAKGLGSDASAFDKLIESQESGRPAFVTDRAATGRDDAAVAARHAGPEMRARLTAERDGECQTYLSPTNLSRN